MATYRWRIDFSLPGVPIAQPMMLDAITLTPAPRDQDGRSSSNGCLRLDTDQFLQDHDVETQAMPQLERIAMAAAALSGSTCEPIVTSVCLDNRDELEQLGVRTPLQNGRFINTFNVIPQNIEGAALTHGYRAVLAFRQEDLSLWLRVARWLWKANSDADPYDQFLALWISFNALYGRCKEKGENEESGIKKYLAQAMPTEPDAAALLRALCRDDLSSLGASGLTLGQKKIRPIANDLQSALGPPQQSSHELVELTFLVIYAVRCAIVHEGGFALPPDREVRLVRASQRVLKAAIMHLLRARLGL